MRAEEPVAARRSGPSLCGRLLSVVTDGTVLSARPIRGLLGGVAGVLFFAGLTAVYYWPVIGPSAIRSFGGDFAAQAVPWHVYISREIFQGRLPHWAPYAGFGFPLLADIEATVFYPLTLLVSLLAGPSPSYQALQLQSVIHFPIAGLGMLLLLRRISVQLPAALFGAVTFMMSGFLWAHSAHLTVVQSASWGPWALLGGAILLERQTWAAAVGTGVALFLALLGGHPQIAYYVGLAVVLTVVVGWAARRGSGEPVPLGRLAKLTAVAFLIGVGLAAVQLIPTAVLTLESIRWKPTATFLLIDALPARNLTTLAIPLAFHGSSHWISVDEFHAYVGILPLVLAACALLWRRDRWTFVFGGLALFGLVVSLGIPGLRWFGGAGLFRVPARAVYLLTLGTAGLAALGADALLRPVPSRRRERVARAVLWAVCLLLSAGGLWLRYWGVPERVRDQLSPGFTAHYLVFLSLFIAALLTIEVARRLRGWHLLGAALLVGGLLADLFVTIPAALGSVAIPPWGQWPPREELDTLAREVGPHRILSEHLFGRSSTMEANVGLLYRLPVVSVYSSLLLKRYVHFMEGLVLTLPRSAHVYDLMGVRYVVSGRDVAAFAAGVGEAGLARGLRDSTGDRRVEQVVGILWAVRDALPRAYLAHDVWVVRNKRVALRALEFVDPRRTVVMERKPVGCSTEASSSGAGDGSTGVARFLTDEPQRIRLSVHAARAAPLVLSDTYYPGWRATIDGDPTVIYRANYLFRAVCVPAGEHVVEFTFRQPGFLVGLVVSAGAGLGALVLLLRRRSH